MRIVRWAGILIAGGVALLALVALGARFADGPIGLFPGGPFRSGPLHEGDVSDWSFAAEEDTVELQLLSQDRARTVWILVHDGQAFIPCSLGFPPGKRWHLRAVQDGRAVLRIAGQRYPVDLARLEDGQSRAALEAIVKAKYGGGPRSDSGVWFFHVTSRTP